MKVKVGDNVKVIAGKDKGKTGRVIKTLKKDNKVVVEGINIIKKHVKPNRMNEVGSIQEMEAPIHVSNVKVEAEENLINEYQVNLSLPLSKAITITGPVSRFSKKVGCDDFKSLKTLVMSQIQYNGSVAVDKMTQTLKKSEIASYCLA